uniref:Lipoprotein n=1 Tax=Staphylococcus schleiferi TaxID=1295 RepID=A0A7Z7QYZ9_STASC|nr:lipoprotein [Staphylococcus schleiferi]
MVKKSKKTIEIDINMDDRIPINVWTGDSIARTGKGTPIKLNLENLSALSNLVTGETSNMLTDCVNYLNESYNISQVENANFGERKHKLKQDFKKIVEVDILEGMSRELTSLKKDAFSAIDNVKKKSCWNCFHIFISCSPYF